MAEILLFDHIGKTAGSTIRRVLWQVYGFERSFQSTVIGEHVARYHELCTRLDTEYPSVSAIVAHTGYGLHERLPQRHRYRLFTLLRDPVQRTLSHYYFEIQRGRLSASVPLVEWLEQDLERAYNVQTAFLGGLAIEQHLDGRPLTKDRFTEGLLECAKASLHAYEVVGLTERFDESLLLLGRTFGWPIRKMRHFEANRGKLRTRRSGPTPEELGAVRAANRLDIALYDYAAGLFEAQLRERLPDAAAQRRALEKANRLYALSAPDLRRRLLKRARHAVRSLVL
jgi:hypothetical protein